MVAEWLNDRPEVLAILLAVAGLLLAAVLSRLAERVITRLGGVARRHLGQRAEQVDLGAWRQMLRAVIYFGTLLVFLLLALRALQISVVQDLLTVLLGYVPQLILAGLIILLGYLLGTLARSLLAGLLAVGSNHMVPRFAQVLVVTAAVLTGLAQTAIDISFVSDVLIILLAFFFGGLSLAFALGSRQLVENLLARRALDRYRIGDHVRINGAQGTIIEILNTAVVLESEHGLLTVPTSRFAGTEVLLVEEQAADDDANRTE